MRSIKEVVRRQPLVVHRNDLYDGGSPTPRRCSSFWTSSFVAGGKPSQSEAVARGRMPRASFVFISSRDHRARNGFHLIICQRPMSGAELVDLDFERFYVGNRTAQKGSPDSRPGFLDYV